MWRRRHWFSTLDGKGAGAGIKLKGITANGRTFPVETVVTYAKTMRGRVIDGKVVISVPERWGRNFAQESAEKVRRSIERALAKNPHAFDRSRIPEFRDMQPITAMGRELIVRIERRDGIRFANARLTGNELRVHLPASASGDALRNEKEVVSQLVLKALSRELYQEFRRRVEEINKSTFNARIGAIRLKNITTRWGSCSARNNLNFSSLLLLFPNEILDSVIVHELAHTMVRRHSDKFWSLVYSAIPDYKERRRWLNRYQNTPLEERPRTYAPLNAGDAL